MNKRELSERDICTKYILPALRQAGWDEMLQVREEFEISRGRIIVRGYTSDKQDDPRPEGLETQVAQQDSRLWVPHEGQQFTTNFKRKRD